MNENEGGDMQDRAEWFVVAIVLWVTCDDDETAEADDTSE